MTAPVSESGMRSHSASVEIMDTTLRDGEQTSGVSFVPHEKLMVARALLNDLNVDRIEVASARVSDGEKDAVTRICKWARSAGYLHRVEVLGFVDDGFAQLDQRLRMRQHQPPLQGIGESLPQSA